MSAKELKFTNGGLTWLKINFENNNLNFTEVDGRRYTLDRNQAHLFLLFLQEHLKS